MRAVHLRLMADLSCWLDERGETSADLGTPLLAEFIACRRQPGTAPGCRCWPFARWRSTCGKPGRCRRRSRSSRPGPWKRRSPSTRPTFVPSAGLHAETIEHASRPGQAVPGRGVRDGGLRDLESLTAADVQAFVLDRARSASPAQGPACRDGAAVAAAVPAPAGHHRVPAGGRRPGRGRLEAVRPSPAPDARRSGPHGGRHATWPP